MREKRAALRRKQSEWEAYERVQRRLDEAYYLMLSTRDEFEEAKMQATNGRDDVVRLKLAEKRHKSAEEEFQYQRNQLIYLLSAGI